LPSLRRPIQLVVIALLISVGLSSCSDDTTSPEDPRFAKVRVPDIQGDRMSTVYDQLEAAGLTGRARYWDREDLAVEVRPSPGTMVDPGTVVRIKTMTSGEIRYYRTHKRVPDLVGHTYTYAGEVLGPHFFRATYAKGDYSNLEQASIILSQSPPAGSPLRPTTKVRFVVAWRPVPGGFDIPGVDIDVGAPNPCSYTRRC